MSKIKFFFQKINVRSFSTVLKTEPYDIPQRYRDSFYLANASLFDSVNWFVHNAYVKVFPDLVRKFKETSEISYEKSYSTVREIIDIIDQCNSTIDVRFPIKYNDNHFKLIRGFRAHHGLVACNSPCLGGIRIHENITRDFMKGFSALSTYRNALLGINLGGAHGGIKIAPSDYGVKELRNIVELFVVELFNKGYLGGNCDICHVDINTNMELMDTVAQTYGRITGHNLNTAAMGKSEYLGGLGNNHSIASLAAYHSLDFFLNNDNITNKLEVEKGLKNKTFIIQGLGKLGIPLAQTLIANGAVCVGVKEVDGYFYDNNGIDLKELLEYKNKNGTIQSYKLTKPNTDDKIYLEQCDILVFAANQKSLICYTADKVKAKVILEASDAALTPMAHVILSTRSQLVVPDILACSGATIAAFLEFLKNLGEFQTLNFVEYKDVPSIYKNLINSLTPEKQIAAGIGGQMIRPAEVDKDVLNNFIKEAIYEKGNELLKIMNDYKLDMDLRTAAYIISTKNLLQTIFNSKKFN